MIARRKYADRYASEDFGVSRGMPAVYGVAAVGIVATCAGVYYSFAASWIPDLPVGTWMTWVGSIAVGMFVLGAVVYFFGRRSAGKVTQEDALAHLAVLDLRTRKCDRMTMESTELHEGTTGDATPYPLDPLTGAEIASAAAVIMDSEYSTPTTKFVMIQLAEPDKNPGLTFEGLSDIPGAHLSRCTTRQPR